MDGRKKAEARPGERMEGADVKAVAAYLAAPAPDTVFALIGEVKKDAAIAKACAKVGDVLRYDVAEARRAGWVASDSAGGREAETDACAALVEHVGEDLHELANEIDKIATWAGGEPVGVPRSSSSSRPRRDADLRAHRRVGAARPRARWTPPRRSSTARADRAETPRRARGALANVTSPGCAAPGAGCPGRPARDAATTLKMHPFYGEKVFARRRILREELRARVVRFAELDLALKGGSRLAPDLELVRALIDVSAERARRRRAS